MGLRGIPSIASGPIGKPTGAENLVTNGGFETDTTSWQAIGLGGSIARTTGESYIGSASMEVTTAGLESFDGSQYPSVTLEDGVTYTASAWVKAPVSVNMRIGLTGTDSNFTGNGDWTRVSVTVVGDGTSFNLSVYNNGAQNHVYHVDAVQLETHPVPTAYIETDGATATREPLKWIVA